MTEIDGRGSRLSDEGKSLVDVRRLADSWTVARNAFWNIAGRAGPMVIAVVATPYLFADLGPTRWGLFALALSLIGIFGIFDFGIGRALTKLLAERLALGEVEDAAALTKTGLVLLSLLGIAGAAILAALAHLWTDHGLRIQHELHDEVLHALYVLCVAVPFVILNAALWGRDLGVPEIPRREPRQHADPRLLLYRTVDRAAFRRQSRRGDARARRLPFGHDLLLLAHLHRRDAVARPRQDGLAARARNSGASAAG